VLLMTRFPTTNKTYKLYREFIYAPQSLYMHLLIRYMSATIDTANGTDCNVCILTTNGPLELRHLRTQSSATRRTSRQANSPVIRIRQCPPRDGPDFPDRRFGRHRQTFSYRLGSRHRYQPVWLLEANLSSEEA
jgi:hypothetical protein